MFAVVDLAQRAVSPEDIPQVEMDVEGTKLQSAVEKKNATTTAGALVVRQEAPQVATVGAGVGVVVAVAGYSNT